jgi:hypothetical protein
MREALGSIPAPKKEKTKKKKKKNLSPKVKNGGRIERTGGTRRE